MTICKRTNRKLQRKFRKGQFVDLGKDGFGKIVYLKNGEVGIHWVGDPEPEVYLKEELHLNWDNKRKIWSGR